MKDNRGLSTKAVHAGEERRKPGHGVTTPVFQSSTFTFADTADLVEFMERRKRKDTGNRCDYGRYGNPTVLAAERKMAELESGESALLFSSGMAAVTLTMLALLSSGAHVVLTDDIYRRTREFAVTYLKRYGVDATKVPMGDYDALEQAIQPNTRLIISESPTNPYLRVVDLPRVVEIAQARGVRTIIDSTFATPINVRPLELGVDLVLHSCTKYLGGHNDLLAGVIVGCRDLVQEVRETQNVMGAVCDPNSAYLLMRGLKTLELRVNRQNETGMRVAQFLKDDPRVGRVHYPGLPEHADHTVAKKQLAGYGGVVSFELNADLEATARFVDALEIPYIGPSLGGTESLVGQVALSSYYDLTPEERAEIGIAEGLVRLAVGVENCEDIIADLSQALGAIGSPEGR
ncbi:MAG: aminotransferase class I/II-fold pyridoxal phosphate-dependent enzyme [Anaerolineales bacterium]|nr:MAG: aminotransferase class I/II-fold pyridoxal phosphate-dependent enzyme [Anaerolineales bacterium]